MTREQISAQGDERERSAAIRLLVCANNWTGAELRSLPRGGSIRIEVETDGPVRLLLADAAGYASFPDIEMALFDRRIEGSAVAEISLPRSGDYYLIADNRGSDDAREVTLALRGRSHDAHQTMPLPRQFEVLQRQMDSAFDLRGLTLQLADPGPERPTTTGRKLVVGRDFIRFIETELPDERAARGAILFAILHGVAADWLADEAVPVSVPTEHLAAALMILFNQIDGARRQAEHFAARATPNGPLADAAADPLSAEVARSVQQRLTDPQTLLRDMQTVFLPRMRPEMLDQLRMQTPGWADPRNIDAALSSHRGARPDDGIRP